MKMRKLYSIMLVLVLLLTMGVPSFAEDETPEDPAQEENVTLDGEETPDSEEDTEEDIGSADSDEEDETPTIGDSDSERVPARAPVLAPKRLAKAAQTVDVVVPSSTEVLINPCRLPVELDGKRSTDQIVSKTMYIRNRSSSAMSLTVEEEVWEGDLRLYRDPLDPDMTNKALFLYAEFQPVANENTEPRWMSEFTDASFLDDDEYGQIVIRDGARKRNMIEMAPSGQMGSCFAMRLFGEAVARPRDPWTVDDQIKILFTFTFEEV